MRACRKRLRQPARLRIRGEGPALFLLAISVYIRLKLNESPVFKKMKAEGKASKAPLTESFLRWGNLKIVLMVLFGGVAGQAVVWYTGQFYALFFLQQTLKVDPTAANYLIAASLVIGTPFFILFGTLSDKIGRKPIIMAGCILAVLTYFPIFKGITRYANPALEHAQVTAPVTVVADEADCSFQFDPIGKAKFTKSCDLAKASLAKKGVPYRNEAAPAGTIATVKIGDVFYGSEGWLEIDADGNWQTFLGRKGTPGPDSKNIEEEASDALSTIGSGMGGHFGNFIADRCIKYISEMRGWVCGDEQSSMSLPCQPDRCYT